MEKLENLWAQTEFRDEEGDRFVKLLLTEGGQAEIVNVNNPDEFQVPDFYDREQFKKGQEYYATYRDLVGFGTFIGAMSLLALESMAEILSCTNKSNTSEAAYKRYAETIMYLNYFYTDSPEDPKSLCCQTIRSVRRKHKHGSIAAQRNNLGIINQRDMVLTLFSYVVYPIVGTDFIAFPEEAEKMAPLCHFWRVIGSMLGIDDQFNVYNGDMATTKSRCQALLKHVFTPAFLNPSAKFEEMCFAALDGLWCLFPEINVESFRFTMNLLNNVPGYYLTEANRQAQLRYLKEYPHYAGDEGKLKVILKDIEENPDICSDYWKKSQLQRFIIRITPFLKCYVYGKRGVNGILMRFVQVIVKLRFYFMVKYPLIAIFRFGRGKAYVDNSIMENYQKMKSGEMSKVK